MKCKSCGRKIEDNSIFCNWCGEKQIKTKKKKDDITVPAPKQRGENWNIYLRAEGVSITEKTPELCVAKAKAVRAGFIEESKKQPRLTFQKASKRFIEENSNILSPSTLRGYEEIARNRFRDYADMDMFTVNWNKAVNQEAALVSAKTVENAWGYVARLFRYFGAEPPAVSLQPPQSKELPWLNCRQIAAFVPAIEGERCEIAALLALHSLRRSELMTICPKNIVDGCIVVDGASVLDRTGNLVTKEENKTYSSKRTIPILIPRLKEILNASSQKDDEPFLTIHPNTAYADINAICEKLGLPKVGLHGLRRSFASLAYFLGWQERETMRVGGWSDVGVMHRFYIKLDNEKLLKVTGKMEEFYKNLQQPLQQG